jgi:hypothetical protein
LQFMKLACDGNHSCQIGGEACCSERQIRSTPKSRVGRLKHLNLPGGPFGEANEDGRKTGR